ncbi:hypothetical protein KI387_038755, partial [Taxus chinensis]
VHSLLPPPSSNNVVEGVLEGLGISLFPLARLSKNLTPCSLLKETEEVHKDSGALASLIKEGIMQGQASSMEALHGWISNNECLVMDFPISPVGALEEGELTSDGLVPDLVPSKISSSQDGLGAALCGSDRKRGRKSKQEVAQLEVDAGKQSTLKFDLADPEK